ncbi:TM2 domain-containing protein [Sulfobacillus harzensis]|uniref:NINE protein n=1 Tax=Sulfobacillus harzensis TaxID=2729629 RepID=A0A7Y0L9Y1_9FIRM|nr:NINE protein [Sulfobacillus harzensis]NMP25155.1 NINE protein [Sulfobacillus harzensis]
MKNKLAAGLLGLFLGGLGIHKFYLGQTGRGILFLVFFWTGIPAIIGFIEGIVLIAQPDDVFNAKYNGGATA